MNIVAVADALNQRAARENWHHFCDPGLGFSDDCYQAFIGLWRNKAAGRPMPARSDLTPPDLKDFLRNIVIFERFAEKPSRYRWRLIGTSITEVAGHHTGKTLEESLPPEHIERYTSCCDLVLDGGQPMRFLGRVHLQGREYLDAENLFVPLANDEGHPTFSMGFCRYTPRRSDEHESWETRLAAAMPGRVA
jgi:hypothetical protein